jgi:hypothetical protein
VTFSKMTLYLEKNSVAMRHALKDFKNVQSYKTDLERLERNSEATLRQDTQPGILGKSVELYKTYPEEL